MRATGAFLLLFAVLLVWRRSTLRVTPGEPLLAVFGVAGLALVAWFYFVAIERLEIGIALLIQYIAPVLVALYARYVLHEPVRRRIWAALALAIVGLTLLLQLWDGLELDGSSASASIGAAITFAPSTFSWPIEGSVAARRPRCSPTGSSSPHSSGPCYSRGRAFPESSTTACRSRPPSRSSCRSGC